MDLGLERAGMECKWQIEIDPYCRKVLAKHWPDIPKYEDITRIQPETLEPVDCLAGGFPCQDLSVAGKRAGLKEGTRSGLWFEFLRLIRALRPSCVLVENVPGLLTNHAMGRVLGDLAESGYDAEWQVLSAAQFGARHLRNRVWIVAYSRCPGGRFQPISFSELQKHDGQKEPLADTNGRGQQKCSEFNSQTEESSTNRNTQRGYPSGHGYDVSNSCGAPKMGLSVRAQQKEPWIGIRGEYVGNSSSQGFPNWAKEKIYGQESIKQFKRSNWWAIEPDVGRVAHGVPSRVDRIRALGNACVPQVVEWIGRQIVRHEELWRWCEGRPRQ